MLAALFVSCALTEMCFFWYTLILSGYDERTPRRPRPPVVEKAMIYD